MLIEKTNNFNAFKDGGAKMLGLATAQLPGFEALAETFRGAGIMGEFNSPALGQIAAMTLSLSFKMLPLDESFAVGKTYRIDLRSALQGSDNEGNQAIIPERWAFVIVITKYDPGKREVATASDASIEGDVRRAQHWVDGKEKLLFDRFSNVFTVDGEDLSEPIRAAIE